MPEKFSSSKLMLMLLFLQSALIVFVVVRHYNALQGWERERANLLAQVQEYEAETRRLNQVSHELCTLMAGVEARKTEPSPSTEDGVAKEEEVVQVISPEEKVKSVVNTLFEFGDIDGNDKTQVENTLLKSSDEYMRALGLRSVLTGTKSEEGLEFARLNIRWDPVSARALYAATYLSQNMNDEIRDICIDAVLEDEALESWGYAVALAHSGDNSFLELLGQRALDMVRNTHSVKPAQRALNACRLHELPRKRDVILQAVHSEREVIRKQAIPLLRADASVEAIAALESLEKDPSKLVSNHARVALKRLRARARTTTN